MTVQTAQVDLNYAVCTSFHTIPITVYGKTFEGEIFCGFHSFSLNRE